jgi:glycosyltransferase involved in cell wall biosynthesis
MNRGKLYGLCLVKNEDDIIAQSLTYAAQYCDRIFVLDNGSTDDTWHIVQRLAQANGAIVPFEQTPKPYGDYLRGMVYEALHCELSDDDWWLIVDADEFLAEAPGPVIETAVEEGADLINTWHIQFFFTDKDLEACQQGRDRRDMPIFDRRRYYHINTQEPRLFRNQTQPYQKVRVKDFVPDSLRRVCRRRIFVRHYQFRDPDQIEKRLRLRYGHFLFPHVYSSDWRSVVCDSRGLTLHRDGEPWRFTASGLLYFYRHRAGAKYHGAIRRVRGLLKRK